VRFAELPTELLVQITRLVQTAGPFVSNALFQTCRPLHAIRLTSSIETIHDLQIRIATAAKSCVDGILTKTLFDVGDSAPLLGLVPKTLRKQVVDRGLSLARYDNRVDAIAQLVSNLEPLQADDRSLLVSGAEAMDEEDQTRVIAEIADQWGHLGRHDRQALFACVVGMQGEQQRGECFGHLGKALSHFDHGEREWLVRSTRYALPDPLASTLAMGLADGLACLDEAQRSELVNTALAIEPGSYRAVALNCLTAGLAHLSLSQRTRILDAVLMLDEISRAGAISEMGAALEHLSEDQRAQLIDAAFALPGPLAEGAIAGLTTNMAHVPERQSTRLFEAVLGIQDRSDRDGLLAWTAAGVADLDDTQRERLVAATIELAPKNPVEQGKAIPALAGQLAFLNRSQRERLFTTCLAIADEGHLNRALKSLAPGLMHLDPPMRGQLLVQVERMSYLPHRATALERLMTATRAAASPH
jgi:hypothetical protein